MRLQRVLGIVWMWLALLLTWPASSLAQVFVVADGASGFIADGSGNTTTGPALDTDLDIPGGYGPVQTVVVDLVLSHPAVGELSAALIAPDGTTHTLFAYTGWNGVDGALVQMGYATRLSGRYLFSDGAFTNWWTTANANTVMPPAVYRTSVPGGTTSVFRGADTLMNPVFAGKASAGKWKLRLTDSRSGNTGTLTSARLILQTALTDVQPPANLKVASIAGNLVTLRWETPALGPTPTGYFIQGGTAPGQSLGTLPMGEPQNSVTFAIGSGTYYLRAHAVNGAMQSPASNEIPLYVTTAVAPSIPAGLTGVVDGSTVHLTWRNTFGGGIPTGSVIDVTGSATGSASLGPGETFSYPGVPGGTYTFRVRSVNAGGTSGASNAVTLSFPRNCGGATPGMPENFLAYAVGRSLNLLWEPPSTGPAASTYMLHVTGAFTGDVPLNGRGISAQVPPGTYTFVLESGNVCGFGGFTSPTTVVVR